MLSDPAVSWPPKWHVVETNTSLRIEDDVKPVVLELPSSGGIQRGLE
jgi:hypothetical protein